MFQQLKAIFLHIFQPKEWKPLEKCNIYNKQLNLAYQICDKLSKIPSRKNQMCHINRTRINAPELI